MTKDTEQAHANTANSKNEHPDASDFAQEDWIALDQFLDEGTGRARNHAPWAQEPQTIELDVLSQASGSSSSGESTEADESMSSGESANADASAGEESTTQIELPHEDLQDDVMVLEISQRHLRVVPGESVTFHLSLRNNGPSAAPFSLQLEGFVQNEWISIEPSHTQLRAGEKGQFTLTVAPPRLSISRAGTFPLYISARSTSYPQRRSRIGLQVDIEPFVAFSFGELNPAKLDSFWHAPECNALLPITNQSNTEAHIYLEGQAGRFTGVHSPGVPSSGSQRPSAHRSGTQAGNRSGTRHMYLGYRRAEGCQIEFLLPGATSSHEGQALIALAPGQTLHMLVRVSPAHRRVVGLRRRTLPFRVTGWIAPAGSGPNTVPAGAEAAPAATRQGPRWGMARTVPGRLRTAPLVGPGAMTAVVGCGLVGMLAVGVVTVALLFTLLLPSLRTSQPVGAPPSVPAAVEIVVKIAEPVPTAVDSAPVAVAGRAGDAPAPQQALPAVPAAAAQAASLPAPGGATGATTLGPEGVPLVQPDMVTAPGQPAAAAISSQDQALYSSPGAEPTPVVVTSAGATSPDAAGAGVPVDTTTMTYEQMFRLVGEQYRLDWRLLAAQAYVESGFNPVALGSQGDLGLMQVLPATWQEWAPQVDATDPFDSYSNVRVAAAYLDYLRSLLDQRNGHSGIEWMLVAYNWGPNQLQEFLNSGSTWADLEESRRKYANDILGIAESLPAP